MGLRMAGHTSCFLGHGASGDARSMQPWVEALREHGVNAEALDLPRGNAERAMTRFTAALEGSPGAAIGGHSYGGRVASMVAAQQPVSALVLLSYPLHRPGHPDQRRVEHWPRIGCPVLLLSGDRDPFARIDLLRAEVQQLRNAELHVYPGLGHGVLAAVDDAAARIARFLKATGRPSGRRT